MSKVIKDTLKIVDRKIEGKYSEMINRVDEDGSNRLFIIQAVKVAGVKGILLEMFEINKNYDVIHDVYKKAIEKFEGIGTVRKEIEVAQKIAQKRK